MSLKNYKPDSIESWAIFYIDKGIPLPILVASLTGTGDNQCTYKDGAPTFPTPEVKAALETMVREKVLAVGPAYGSDQWVVVREWMPNTAIHLDTGGLP